MTNINELIEKCQGIVMNCRRNVLIIKLFDEIKVYIASQITLKNRDIFYNEVRDAQDITVIVNNINFAASQGWNEDILNEKTQSIHKQDFKFGTDEFMWITRVDMNRG